MDISYHNSLSTKRQSYWNIGCREEFVRIGLHSHELTHTQVSMPHEELAIVTLLKSHGLDYVVAEYDIIVKRSKTHPSLLLFKYSRSPRTEADYLINRECRGLILDSSQNWKVVAYPYTRFFSMNEKYAAKIDWTTAKVSEKVDGSLMTMYYYNHEWRVASSGNPDAAGTVANKQTLGELFWTIFHAQHYKYPHDSQRHYCFMFELLSPLHPLFVHVTSDSLILHGVRNLTTLSEESPLPFAQTYGFELAQNYVDFNTLEEVVEASRGLNPSLQEGYIVCDAAYNRIKIKSPSFVALANLSSKDMKWNTNRIATIFKVMQTDETSEFLCYHPEWVAIFQSLSPIYQELVDRLQHLYDYKTLDISQHISSRSFQEVSEELKQLAQNMRLENANKSQMYLSKSPLNDARHYLSLLKPVDFRRLVLPQLMARTTQLLPNISSEASEQLSLKLNNSEKKKSSALASLPSSRASTSQNSSINISSSSATPKKLYIDKNMSNNLISVNTQGHSKKEQKQYRREMNELDQLLKELAIKDSREQSKRAKTNSVGVTCTAESPSSNQNMNSSSIDATPGSITSTNVDTCSSDYYHDYYLKNRPNQKVKLKKRRHVRGRRR